MREPRVRPRIAAIQRPSGLSWPWPVASSHPRTRALQVLVRDNNVDQALRVLKKKMQREGLFREMKQHSAYEKPSERKVRERAEAVRRARKAARKIAIREGLIAAPKPKPRFGGGPCDPRSPGGRTRHRPPEVSSTAFPARLPDLPPRPLMVVDFAIHGSLVRAGRPRIRFLSIRPRFCSTLPSDPTSRRRPCASLTLRHHQAG